jgi:putative ABC transport system permease protein
VGVVADYSNNPLHPGRAQAKIFLPLPPFAKDVRGIHLLIRAAGDPGPLVETVRRGIAAAFTGTVVVYAGTVEGSLEAMSQELLLGSAPLFPLIAIAMFLTISGIYGVLAFAITRRSRELAVRVAVGASARDLIRLVAVHTLRLVGTGSALGIAVTFGLARVVRAGGGGGTIFDPENAAFVLPLAVLLVVAAVATWIPSRRALKIDPAVLLRSQ